MKRSGGDELECRPLRNGAVVEYDVGADLLLDGGDGAATVTLNPFAAAVWRLCNGRRSVYEITGVVAESLACPPHALFADVERTVDELRHARLLRIPVAPPQRPVVSRPMHDDIGLELDGLQFGIRCTDPGLNRLLVRRFEPWHGAPRAAVDVGIELVRDRHGFVILADGRPVRAGTDRDQCLREVERELIRQFMTRRDDLVWFHAGAAVRDDRAVMIVGPGACGKSTLVAELCQRGWQYLSDESVPVVSDTVRAIPFPRTPAARENPAGVLGGTQISRLRKRTIPIDPASVRRRSAAIGAVILPEWMPAAPASLVRETPSGTARALLDACLSFHLHGRAAVRCAACMARELPAYRLTHRGGGDGTDLVEALWAVDGGMRNVPSAPVPDLTAGP